MVFVLVYKRALLSNSNELDKDNYRVSSSLMLFIAFEAHTSQDQYGVPSSSNFSFRLRSMKCVAICDLSEGVVQRQTTSGASVAWNFPHSTKLSPTCFKRGIVYDQRCQRKEKVRL